MLADQGTDSKCRHAKGGRLHSHTKPYKTYISKRIRRSDALSHHNYAAARTFFFKTQGDSLVQAHARILQHAMIWTGFARVPARYNYWLGSAAENAAMGIFF